VSGFSFAAAHHVRALSLALPLSVLFMTPDNLQRPSPLNMIGFRCDVVLLLAVFFLPSLAQVYQVLRCCRRKKQLRA
jgi:hypothetical protein